MNLHFLQGLQSKIAWKQKSEPLPLCLKTIKNTFGYGY